MWSQGNAASRLFAHVSQSLGTEAGEKGGSPAVGVDSVDEAVRRAQEMLRCIYIYTHIYMYVYIYIYIYIYIYSVRQQ
jgi:hypothetical protein